MNRKKPIVPWQWLDLETGQTSESDPYEPYVGLVKALRQVRYKCLICKRPMLDGFEVTVQAMAQGLHLDEEQFFSDIGYYEKEKVI